MGAGKASAETAGIVAFFQWINLWRFHAGLVESGILTEGLYMMRDTAAALGGEIAERIARLQAEELDDFVRRHLRRRDLHDVVANLNAAVLSKTGTAANSARQALERIGFTD